MNWKKTNLPQILISNRYGHDVVRTSKLPKGNQDAVRQTLYALWTWQDTLYRTT